MSSRQNITQCQYLYRENFREHFSSRSVEEIRLQFRQLLFFLQTYIHTFEFQRCSKNNSFSNKSPYLLSSLNHSSLVHIAVHFPHSCTEKKYIFPSTSIPSVLTWKFIVYITKKKQRYWQPISVYNAMRNNSNAKTTSSFPQKQATSKSAVSTNWQLLGISASLDCWLGRKSYTEAAIPTASLSPQYKQDLVKTTFHNLNFTNYQLTIPR